MPTPRATQPVPAAKQRSTSSAKSHGKTKSHVKTNLKVVNLNSKRGASSDMASENASTCDSASYGANVACVRDDFHPILGGVESIGDGSSEPAQCSSQGFSQAASLPSRTIDGHGMGQHGMPGMMGGHGMGQQGMPGMPGMPGGYGMGQQGMPGMPGGYGMGQQGMPGMPGGYGMGQQGMPGGYGMGQQGMSGMPGGYGMGQQGMPGMPGGYGMVDGYGMVGGQGMMPEQRVTRYSVHDRTPSPVKRKIAVIRMRTEQRLLAADLAEAEYRQLRM